MIFAPDFYSAFSCRASACRHSCCRGWEIDVDEAALRRYASVPGALGQKLRASVYQDDDGAHFRLTADERCPFLQRDGLCELICRLGKDALCDICALHPRFFLSYGEYELAGLGLSCEAVCDLLLRGAGPLTLVCAETGERRTLSELLCLSPERLVFDGAPVSAAYLARAERTEPIDDAWPRELERLCRDLASCPPLPAGERYDRILQYILFRQLDRLEDLPPEALIAFARDSAAFVAAQDVLYGESPEHLRRWSEQMEYSTENIERLLS